MGAEEPSAEDISAEPVEIIGYGEWHVYPSEKHEGHVQVDLKEVDTNGINSMFFDLPAINALELAKAIANNAEAILEDQ